MLAILEHNQTSDKCFNRILRSLGAREEWAEEGISLFFGMILFILTKGSW